MNKYKFFTNKYLIFVFVIIIGTIIINYIVDPFQQYREAKFYTFKVQKQRYLNAGLIKNYKYDSIIIGSSMMANFDCDKVNEKLNFNKSIKALNFGGVISEEVYTFNIAKKHNKIKNVLLSLDLYSFSSHNTPVVNNKRFPLFLYDDSILNDQKYLLNLKVFRDSIRSIFNVYDETKINNNLNKLYDWQEEYKNNFSGKELLNDYNIRLKKNTNEEYMYKFKILKNNFDKYLLPILRDNKNINFYLFYPPYSDFAYKLMKKDNYFDDYIKFKKYIFKNISKYKNVKLFDFQVANEIILNNKNYKDIFHYHKRVSNLILNYMSKDKYLVTQKNIKE